MVNRRADLLRRATRGSGALVLSGALSGVAVYALVAGSPPLYETEAVLAAPAPALLAQHDRVMDRAGTPRGGVAAADEKLDRADLGDVGAIAQRIRARLGPRAADSEAALRVDSAAGEAAVVVRGRHAQTARRVADDIAAGIVGARDAATAAERASVRDELRLVAGLAARDRRLRTRRDALRARLAALARQRRTPGGGLTVLRQARTPTEPVAPRVARDVILATVAGMLAWATLSRLRRDASTRRRRLRAAPA